MISLAVWISSISISSSPCFSITVLLNPQMCSFCKASALATQGHWGSAGFRLEKPWENPWKTHGGKFTNPKKSQQNGGFYRNNSLLQVFANVELPVLECRVIQRINGIVYMSILTSSFTNSSLVDFARTRTGFSQQKCKCRQRRKLEVLRRSRATSMGMGNTDMTEPHRGISPTIIGISLANRQQNIGVMT